MARISQSQRAYAYPTSGSAARQRQEYPSRPSAPRISVIGGGAQGAQGAQGAPHAAHEASTVLVVATVVAAVLLAVAVASFVRIAFISASVTTGIESQQISAQLDADRSAAKGLEVQDTLLSNTGRVKTEAEKLGMAAPASAEEIVLPEDVVAVDSAGRLSLTGSVQRASARIVEG